MGRAVILVSVIALTVAACGSDSSVIGADGAGSGSSGAELSNGEAQSTVKGGSVTVVLDGTTHEFGGASCSAFGTILLGFVDGADQGTVTWAEDVSLVRLEIDGVQHVDLGSPPPPMAAGSEFTWSVRCRTWRPAKKLGVEITYDC